MHRFRELVMTQEGIGITQLLLTPPVFVDVVIANVPGNTSTQANC